jgi:N-acetylglutamate synthase-like GNAT family acetyltransferase
MTIQIPATSIRRAQPSDLGTVQSIVTDAYTPYIARIGRKPGPMLDDYAGLIEANQVHVLEQDGGAVGVLVLIPEASALLLDNVAIRPDRHGRGLGRVLLDFAEAEARRHGLPAIRLYTHEMMTENLAIYRARGYRETHRATEKGLARVFMVKALEEHGWQSACIN